MKNNIGISDRYARNAKDGSGGSRPQKWGVALARKNGGWLSPAKMGGGSRPRKPCDRHELISGAKLPVEFVENYLFD